MTSYLIKRFVHGAISICFIVAIVMILIYSLMDRNLVFKDDGAYTKQKNNNKVTYMNNKWEEYGYLDFITYSDWLSEKLYEEEIDRETFDRVVGLGNKEKDDSAEVAQYVAEFTQYYESEGFTVDRLDAVTRKKKIADGGKPVLYATKDVPVLKRLLRYVTGLVTVDNIHTVHDEIEDRGISFTLHDPVYGGEKFAPAIMATGTEHKYLLYTDNKFPFIHQNLIELNLGLSYAVNNGVDVWTTMTRSQGSYETTTVTYPTGYVEECADDLHSATYAANSLHSSMVYETRYTDDYTKVALIRNGKSKMGYSFTIGIIEVCLAYIIGLPLGVLMARKKDKLTDKIGTLYIVFIIAVPSLAYIFLFKAIGGKLGLPTTFKVDGATAAMYILPIISLALPAVAGLMKWMRRYMIDQMNADYVKFARSGGLSEKEIFSKHIMKNAAVPMLHNLPADLLFALTGAIITERVYSVPGVGNMLTEAINKYDNGVIVGMTLFYAVLSVTALILGDVLMATIDPRISFSSKDR